MAFANFHTRSATAASQVLSAFDLTAFDETLRTRRVGVAYDTLALSSPEAAVTLELTVNLLARLYPKLSFLELTGTAAATTRSMVRLARSINPNVEIDSIDELTACIVVGNTRLNRRANPVYIGSDGWIAALSPSAPVSSGRSSNPFGAAAAACFAAANVFRSVFHENLQRPERDARFSFSVLDQVVNPRAPRNPRVGVVDVGELHVVGVGAVGNAALWALSRGPQLRGAVHLVDPEAVELSNLQRYVLMGQREVGKRKVDIAARSLRKRGVKVTPHALNWSDYLVQRNDWTLDTVLVSVDSGRDRISVQAALPRYLINAWTQPGDLGISRHGFLDDNACLACLYLPDRATTNEDEVIAASLGMSAPDEVKDVRRRLQEQIPTDLDFLRRVASAVGVPLDALQPFEGAPLRSFYTRAICGGALFQLTDGKRSGPAMVPLAFQSALAGVLLAAEAVAHAKGYSRPEQTKSAIDLLRPLGRHVLEHRRKASDGSCLCQDPDFIAAWNAKYATA